MRNVFILLLMLFAFTYSSNSQSLRIFLKLSDIYEFDTKFNKTDLVIDKKHLDNKGNEIIETSFNKLINHPYFDSVSYVFVSGNLYELIFIPKESNSLLTLLDNFYGERNSTSPDETLISYLTYDYLSMLFLPDEEYFPNGSFTITKTTSDLKESFLKNQAEKERLKRLIDKYGEEIANKIVSNHSFIGMTKEMLIEAWKEKPFKINTSVGSWGINEQVIYKIKLGDIEHDYYFYFENNSLTSWQY